MIFRAKVAAMDREPTIQDTAQSEGKRSTSGDLNLAGEAKSPRQLIISNKNDADSNNVQKTDCQRILLLN